MTRAALLALLVLGGCAPMQHNQIATDQLPPDWELVTDDQGAAVFVWCDDSPLEWCPSVRRGPELGVLQPGGRIGGGSAVWDTKPTPAERIE